MPRAQSRCSAPISHSPSAPLPQATAHSNCLHRHFLLSSINSFTTHAIPHAVRPLLIHTLNPSPTLFPLPMSHSMSLSVTHSLSHSFSLLCHTHFFIPPLCSSESCAECSGKMCQCDCTTIVCNCSATRQSAAAAASLRQSVTHDRSAEGARLRVEESCSDFCGPLCPLQQHHSRAGHVERGAGWVHESSALHQPDGFHVQAAVTESAVCCRQLGESGRLPCPTALSPLLLAARRATILLTVIALTQSHWSPLPHSHRRTSPQSICPFLDCPLHSLAASASVSSAHFRLRSCPSSSKLRTAPLQRSARLPPASATVRTSSDLPADRSVAPPTVCPCAPCRGSECRWQHAPVCECSTHKDSAHSHRTRALSHSSLNTHGLTD